jgi:phospholipid-binding lipoprotein MlaA
MLLLLAGCAGKEVPAPVQQENNVSAAVSSETEMEAAEDTGFDEFDEFAEFEEEFDGEAAEEEWDPLSGYNRAMTTFNDAFYTHVLFPVARGYRYVVPEDGRVAIANFFDNLMYPLRLVNNLLQLKFKNSAEETGRFVINTTVGLLGFFDPAESWFGLEEHDEDFGQTLGYWGVGAGPHIVLPILGPSNLRDTFSMAADWEVDPLVYQGERNYNLVSRDEEGWMVKSFDYLNDGSFNIEEYESLKKDAVDLYPFFKNIYEQMRKKKIEE